MGKFKPAIGTKFADAKPEGGSFYDGPVPPAGPYSVTLKFVRIKENKNGDDMLNGVAEISEPVKSPKSKYNGYGVWFNLNITEQGAPYVNEFLRAFGLQPKKFYAGEGNVTDESNDTVTLLKIGGKRVEGLEARIVGKKSTYNGNERLEAARWLHATETTDAEDDEADQIADEAEDEMEDAAGIDADDEDDDEGDDDEPEEDEDDDEDDDDEALTEEELDEMSLADVKAVAKEFGIKVLKSSKKDSLIEKILAAQDEDDDEEEAPF